MTNRADAKDLYLAALRGDVVAQRKCTARGKLCGGRCIPKNWNCRITGEGETPPTRGNAVQLTEAQKTQLRGVRARRRRNKVLRTLAGAAGVGGAAVGAAYLASRNPKATLRMANRAGNVSSLAGAFSNLPGAAGRAAAVVNLGVGAFKAGANMGASLVKNRKGVQRLKELRKVLARTQVSGQRVQASITGLRGKLSTYERERSNLMTRMANGGNTAQRRGLRSLNIAIQQINADIQSREAKRAITTRRIASLTKATKKMEGLLTSDYNVAAKVMKTVEEGNTAFRRGRRQTSNLRPQGKRGPKPDRRSWQERLGLDTAEERMNDTYWANRTKWDAAGEKRLGKPCGASHISKKHICHENEAKTNQNWQKAAIIGGAVAGGAVVAHNLPKRRSGEWWKDHKWALSDEEADRIIEEAIKGGKKWPEFERRKALYEAACARSDEEADKADESAEQLSLRSPLGKRTASARIDAWNSARSCRGEGAFGQYFVHSSEKYGIKLFKDYEDYEDYDSRPEADMLEYANSIGVPSPRMLKYNGRTMIVEHLRDYVAVDRTNFGMGRQFGPNIPKEIKKNFITAVRAMHIEGMAHNDLHMGNVMVDNVSRRVKLIDFGLASLRSDDDTFRGERGSRLLRKELESIPDMLNFGKTGSKIIRTKYEDALQLVEDIADAETGYYHRKNHGWAREEYLDRLGWDKAEFIINRYYDNLTRIVELRPDRPNGRSY